MKSELQKEAGKSQNLKKILSLSLSLNLLQCIVIVYQIGWISVLTLKYHTKLKIFAKHSRLFC
jgi:hypothetical protein